MPVGIICCTEGCIAGQDSGSAGSGYRGSIAYGLIPPRPRVERPPRSHPATALHIRCLRRFSLHFCVTLVHTKPGVADQFVSDMTESVAEIMKDPTAKCGGQVRLHVASVCVHVYLARKYLFWGLSQDDAVRC